MEFESTESKLNLIQFKSCDGLNGHTSVHASEESDEHFLC